MPNDIALLLGRRLRAARKAARLTLQQLAEALGLSASQISKYENGLDRVPADRLPAMATLLGVDVGWLFSEEETGHGHGTPGTAAMAALLERIGPGPQRDALFRLAASMAEAAQPPGSLTGEPAPARVPAVRSLVEAGRLGDGLAERLHLALEGATDDLALFYQPVLAADGMRLIGFEGLLRWRGGRDRIGPKQILATAEAAGLGAALDDWVLARGIAQAAAWLPRAPGLSLSLNLSGPLLQDPACLEKVGGLLDQHKLPPGMICLEITEATMLDQTAIERLRVLRDHGVALAIDDFGIGHSSLARLLALEVEVLKLDRHFLEGKGIRSARQTAMLGALVRLAHAAGARLVAEGVDSREAMQAARQAGCDGVQGFLFAPALPPEEAARWLDAEVSASASVPALAYGRR